MDIHGILMHYTHTHAHSLTHSHTRTRAPTHTTQLFVIIAKVVCNLRESCVNRKRRLNDVNVYKTDNTSRGLPRWPFSPTYPLRRVSLTSPSHQFTKRATMAIIVSWPNYNVCVFVCVCVRACVRACVVTQMNTTCCLTTCDSKHYKIRRQ